MKTFFSGAASLLLSGGVETNLTTGEYDLAARNFSRASFQRSVDSLPILGAYLYPVETGRLHTLYLSCEEVTPICCVKCHSSPRRCVPKGTRMMVGKGYITERDKYTLVASQ